MKQIQYSSHILGKLNIMSFHLKTLCLLVVLSFSFWACTDENEPFIDVPDELVGQWRQVSEVNANCPNPANNGTADKDCSVENCLEYTFQADGTLTRRSVEDGNRNVETNSFTLDKEELYIEKGQTLEILTYELFEDQLNLIYRDEITRCTVIQVFTSL